MRSGLYFTCGLILLGGCAHSNGFQSASRATPDPTLTTAKGSKPESIRLVAFPQTGNTKTGSGYSNPWSSGSTGGTGSTGFAAQSGSAKSSPSLTSSRGNLKRNSDQSQVFESTETPEPLPNFQASSPQSRRVNKPLSGYSQPPGTGGGDSRPNIDSRPAPEPRARQASYQQPVIRSRNSMLWPKGAEQIRPLGSSGAAPQQFQNDQFQNAQNQDDADQSGQFGTGQFGTGQNQTGRYQTGQFQDSQYQSGRYEDGQYQDSSDLASQFPAEPGHVDPSQYGSYQDDQSQQFPSHRDQSPLQQAGFRTSADGEFGRGLVTPPDWNSGQPGDFESRQAAFAEQSGGFQTNSRGVASPAPNQHADFIQHAEHVEEPAYPVYKGRPAGSRTSAQPIGRSDTRVNGRRSQLDEVSGASEHRVHSSRSADRGARETGEEVLRPGQVLPGFSTPRISRTGQRAIGDEPRARQAAPVHERQSSAGRVSSQSVMPSQSAMVNQMSYDGQMSPEGPALPGNQIDPQPTSRSQALRSLTAATEREVATLTPGQTANELQFYIERHVYLRLLYLMAGQTEWALRPIPEIPRVDQEFWTQVLWGVHNYFDLHQVPNPTERAAQTIMQFNQAILRLKERAPLEVKNVVFSSKIDGFGEYQTYPRDEFAPGQRVLLYAEIANFHSELTTEGVYRTRLKSTLEFYSADTPDEPLERKNYPVTEDICRNHRHDYFHSYVVDIPARCGKGRHLLKLVIEDELSGKIAEYPVEFGVR